MISCSAPNRQFVNATLRFSSERCCQSIKLDWNEWTCRIPLGGTVPCRGSLALQLHSQTTSWLHANGEGVCADVPKLSVNMENRKKYNFIDVTSSWKFHTYQWKSPRCVDTFTCFSAACLKYLTYSNNNEKHVQRFFFKLNISMNTFNCSNVFWSFCPVSKHSLFTHVSILILYKTLYKQCRHQSAEKEQRTIKKITLKVV